MPKGVDAVMRNTYVDDLVISFHSEKEAETVAQEAILINAAGGFKLRNFVSNSKDLQKRLNGNDNPNAAIISMEKQANVDKILGMYWNSEKDLKPIFHFKFCRIAPEILQCIRPPTKRELLAIVMSIYDPFGFLACITIAGKLLIQAMWKQKIQWDEHLPNHLSNSWSTWWSNFKTIKTLSIPRCYGKLLPIAQEVQLHIFVDASSTAYAAVAYLRMRQGNKVHVAFICAKSRCAPVKGMTIPRLELQAAILGCRLKTFIEQSQNFRIHRLIFWSDSQTVIMWIRSSERKYKPFVEHRIAEILTTTTSDMWRWLPSHANVADDATRATLTKCSSHRWFVGPEFLQLGEREWPDEPAQLYSPDYGSEETPVRILLSTVTGDLFKFTNYSSFLKITRIVAWTLRFISNVRSHSRQVGELTPAEVRGAEKYICRRIQHECFPSEASVLRANQPLPKSSCLHKLTPFIDEDDLIRVSGRIDAAYCLPLSARRPIILPQKHYVTRLIMQQFHARRHHQNDHLVINEMRQKYWVPSARKLLQSIKRACPICIRWTAKPAVPLMGQLPTDRLTPFVRPFSYAGVDYCGPFLVTIGRRTEKRWVALFTCMTTRAIHLEVAEDLSTDSFVICLRNFINRRGVPVRIRSDNGTNFVGAQREMRSEYKLFDFERIDQEMTKHNIEWRFNCPANPNAGGCWERLIQCVKKLLQRVLKEEAPRVETLRSALIEAENIVNSRPLTEIPVSPHDEEPLTPNHFLFGCTNSTQTPSLDERHICPRKQWKIAQNLKDRIWKRWMVEYLPQLLCRPKWTEETDPLQLDQLVI
ncbi:uncharacterized protein LOC118756363, partial [Rhagoletis pomonella]|uniref:uncharacterized protein LOC118756363 n=1 Tax=Rhagoletis pomonella TaxID=28610 RepID=UPI001786BDC2